MSTVVLRMDMQSGRTCSPTFHFIPMPVKLGFGGHSPLFKNTVAAGMFNEQEKGTSSTERERVNSNSSRTAIIQKGSKVQKVKVFSDNQGASKILVAGSRKPHLQCLAVKIFKLSIENNFSSESQWILRDENERADQISKFLDKDYWQLNPSSFRLIDAMWGPHTCDRFASHYSAQLSRFNSRFASPGTEAVDAFSQDWSKDDNWICPPPGIILEAIRHMKQCHALGTLIVPHWPSGLFWPVL